MTTQRHSTHVHRSTGRSQNGLDQTVASSTAHDWVEEKNRDKDFYDDGTAHTTFFRHLTLIVMFFLALFCVAVFQDPNTDWEYKTKRGLVAMVLVFVLFGVTQVRDGPFKQPHPAYWRMVLCLSVVYELGLVFLLSQSVDDARQLMKNFDSNLGVVLPEKDYAKNCSPVYDSDRPDDPWHNLKDKIDGFTAFHFFGYWVKTMSMRDYWLCMVISISFELLEYTLKHQLENFAECWWDSWVMDAVICNGIGIYFGMKTLKYLSMKPYNWRETWNIQSCRGKISQGTDFDRRLASIRLKRWLFMIVIICFIQVSELNTFYLKFILWIPSDHYLTLGRLSFYLLFVGPVALREAFDFLENSHCKLGAQAWIFNAMVITEMLICVKFDTETITKPLPPLILSFWVMGIIGLVLWTIWHFYLQQLLRHTEQKLSNGEDSETDANANQPQLQRFTRSQASRKQL